MKVSDYIANFLEQHHVKETFLAPGESAVHLLDAIGRHEGLSFICSQGERSASLAAEGYAKSSGELGVLVVSSGGAGLNATLGVGNAWIDSVPMLVISGQTRTDQYSTGTPRQLDNKSLNIVDIVNPITKYVAKVDDPMSIRYHLEKAVFLATEGRPGPVWIDIPVDIQGATIDINELEPFVPVGSPSISKTSGTKIPEVLALLEKAKRPVILAGNGIRISKAKREFLELVSALNIPVLTSRRGADLLHEDHPLFFGRPGIYGQRRANFVIQNSDVLLSVGSRLSIPLTGRNTKTFARVAKKIVVDIDPGELNKETIIPDVALQMSAKDFICEMLRRVKTYGGEHRDWVIRCEEWACKFPPLGSDNGSTDRLMCHNVVSALADVMQENAVIVVDGGSPVHSMMQSFMFKSKQRLISSTGLELPGFALAGAIGVSISRGRSPVLCLCEDRGFHVSVPELQTIMDYKLPIKMFIFKTDGNSNIRKLQRDYFGERYVGTDREMLWGSPAIANIANAYGVYAFKINHLEHLSAHLGRVIDYPGPVICEVQVEDDQDIRPRVGFTIKDEGRWVPKPLEDMHPYLNRDTLKENMLIGLVDED
ncbi:MAG TPA: thiamine pyrophosphate-binding protein, partial [Nitrospirales bacterium]|nr:thiamine pyrophosphate-binding protein [Nitrospirales bacterium]